MANCTHLDQIHGVEPSAHGCEEYLKTGNRWVHLREFLACGYVGRCDSSVSLLECNALSFRAALSPPAASKPWK